MAQKTHYYSFVRRQLEKAQVKKPHTNVSQRPAFESSPLGYTLRSKSKFSESEYQEKEFERGRSYTPPMLDSRPLPSPDLNVEKQLHFETQSSFHDFSNDKGSSLHEQILSHLSSLQSLKNLIDLLYQTVASCVPGRTEKVEGQCSYCGCCCGKAEIDAKSEEACKLIRLEFTNLDLKKCSKCQLLSLFPNNSSQTACEICLQSKTAPKLLSDGLGITMKISQESSDVAVRPRSPSLQSNKPLSGNLELKIAGKSIKIDIGRQANYIQVICPLSQSKRRSLSGHQPTSQQQNNPNHSKGGSITIFDKPFSQTETLKGISSLLSSQTHRSSSSSNLSSQGLTTWDEIQQILKEQLNTCEFSTDPKQTCQQYFSKYLPIVILLLSEIKGTFPLQSKTIEATFEGVLALCDFILKAQKDSEKKMDSLNQQAQLRLEENIMLKGKLMQLQNTFREHELKSEEKIEQMNALVKKYENLLDMYRKELATHNKLSVIKEELQE
ncbi:unnamed protein product [Blepharisma stoltei]|uniref:Uncharacterized protein n=1 Tax=Blepharisma stoltei TaxID=1481888 RepID=A0AAU9JE52_9CILI|nr:unnamed protein product [Blepharisma stoltei]